MKDFKKLKIFLNNIHRGLWNEYCKEVGRKGMKCLRKSEMDCKDLTSCTFVWDASKKGLEFWSAVDRAWIKYCECIKIVEKG